MKNEMVSTRTKRRPRMRRGVTYLEYAMLAALVGIVGAVGVKLYGEKLLALFQTLGDKTAEVAPKKES